MTLARTRADVAGAKAPRTQEERRAQTRNVLLEATVSCLVELGYARTTTLEVQKRAGVSRGALLHHFPCKAELLTATVKYLATLRGRELADKAAELPKGGAKERIDAVLDLLWQSFSGPLFYVAIELRTAARTDNELRAVLTEVERVVHQRILDQSRQLFGDPIASEPGFDCALNMTLQLMIGSAMSMILHRDEKQARDLITGWKAIFRQILAAHRPKTKPRKNQAKSRGKSKPRPDGAAKRRSQN